MALKLITPPVTEPLTLEEMIAYLRVDGSDLDNIILGLIQAAREYAEGYTNRAFVSQTWELVLDSWPTGDVIEIPKPPLQSITSIKYYDTAGTEYIFDTSNYIVDTDSFIGRAALAYNFSWPSNTLQPVNGIRIRFVCGYGTADDVPQSIKNALKMWIQYTLDQLEIPDAVNILLGQERVIPI